MQLPTAATRAVKVSAARAVRLSAVVREQRQNTFAMTPHLCSPNTWDLQKLLRPVRHDLGERQKRCVSEHNESGHPDLTSGCGAPFTQRFVEFLVDFWRAVIAAAQFTFRCAGEDAVAFPAAQNTRGFAMGLPCWPSRRCRLVVLARSRRGSVCAGGGHGHQWCGSEPRK